MPDAAPARRRGPYAKTAHRRAEIIESATAVFSAHGYQGGSLRQIAKQLDLSLTTVMHHFPTKVALLAAVLDQEDRADPDAATRSHRDGFIPMVLGIVERNLGRRELVRMFSIVSAEATYPGHEAHDWLVARYASVTATYTALISSDREAGRIRSDRSPELLAQLVISGWEGIQIRWLADDTDPVEAMRVLLEELLDPPRRIHVSAAVILDDAGRLLVVRKANTTAFMQPGGKPEPGESAAETLSRELDEELGIRVDPEEMHPLGAFTAAAANEPGFLVVADVFTVDIGDQTPVVAAEIAELRWITRADAAQLEVAPLARENFLPR